MAKPKPTNTTGGPLAVVIYIFLVSGTLTFV